MNSPAIFRLSLLLFVTAPLMGQAPTSAPRASAPAAISQWRGQTGGLPELTTQVLRTVAAWNAAWKRIGMRAPQELNEAREMAVAIFAGERRTGGFVVSVTRVSTDTNGALVVEYEIPAPAADAIVTQAVAYPWAITVVPKNDRPVIFRRIEREAAKR